MGRIWRVFGRGATGAADQQGTGDEPSRDQPESQTVNESSSARLSQDKPPAQPVPAAEDAAGVPDDLSLADPPRPDGELPASDPGAARQDMAAATDSPNSAGEPPAEVATGDVTQPAPEHVTLPVVQEPAAGEPAADTHQSATEQPANVVPPTPIAADLDPASVAQPSTTGAQGAATEPLALTASPEHELPLGTVLAGRFTVLRELTPEAAAGILGNPVPEMAAALYAVEDQQGFEHCWSCGSKHNDRSQRFCVDCGAPQQREWVLAQTSSPTGLADEFAESGVYYHLLHRRKQFGSTGVWLEVGAFSAEGPHFPNEDSCWVGATSGCYDSKAQSLGVAVLADGMGGYAPGSGLISKVIADTVGHGVFGALILNPELTHDENSLRASVHGAIADANGKVLEEIGRHGDMGATLVVAIVYGHDAYVANIGDSRAYYISPSGTVAQITRDQSLVEQQVSLGLMAPDAVFTAQGNNVILHAVGEDRVEDVFDWYVQPLEPGSYVLLCSDGYWKTMRHDIWDPELAASQSSLHMLSRSMVQRALDQNSDDNTTVVLAGVE